MQTLGNDILYTVLDLVLLVQPKHASNITIISERLCDLCALIQNLSLGKCPTWRPLQDKPFLPRVPCETLCGTQSFKQFHPLVGRSPRQGCKVLGLPLYLELPMKFCLWFIFWGFNKKKSYSLPMGLQLRSYFPDSSVVMSSSQKPFFKYLINLASRKIKKVS